MSGPAHRASSTVRDLTAALDKGRERLRGFQSQLASAKALGDIEGYRTYSKAVDGARRTVFELGRQLDLLGGPSRSAASSLQRVVEPAEVLRHALHDAAGGVRALGSALSQGD